MEDFKTWFQKCFLVKNWYKVSFFGKNGKYGSLGVPVGSLVTKTEACQLYEKSKLFMPYSRNFRAHKFSPISCAQKPKTFGGIHFRTPLK